MSVSVDKSLYNIVTYSGNGDNRKIEFTPKGLSLICATAFDGKFKKLSGDAVRMLIQCVDESRFASHTKGFSTNVVNELTTPWVYASDGAVLYPEEYQPWERCDEAFFQTDNPKKLPGHWISSTYHAEIAAKLIKREMAKLKDRIREVEQLPLTA